MNVVLFTGSMKRSIQMLQHKLLAGLVLFVSRCVLLGRLSLFQLIKYGLLSINYEHNILWVFRSNVM